MYFIFKFFLKKSTFNNMSKITINFNKAQCYEKKHLLVYECADYL